MSSPPVLQAAVAALALTASVPAQVPHSHGPSSALHAASIWNHAFLTGNWGGVRDRMEDAGYSVSLLATIDVSKPFSGGLEQRDTTRALYTAALEIDLERAAGLGGASAYVEAYSQTGRNASEDVGDAQVFSNIDEENVTQLSELWFEQTTSTGDLRVKVGKLDANTEFAYAEAGLEFLHSSAGYTPTLFVFPTYPDPAVSLNVFARPTEGVQLGLGIYNAGEDGAVSGRRGMTAEFDETFFIAEVDGRWEDLGGLGQGRLAVGVWQHTGQFEQFDGGSEDGTEGVYAIFEQNLTREGPTLEGDGQGLDAFVQWGIADGDVSEIESHLGAGLLYTGLIPGRDSWLTGLYLSHVGFTDEPGAGLGGDELAIELFQQVDITPALAIKPDLQVIVDPSGRDDIDDAWVFTLRLELSL